MALPVASCVLTLWIPPFSFAVIKRIRASAKKMDNIEIAELFEQLSKFMTLHGENTFKIRSYAKAAFTIERLPQSLAKMSPEDIGQIPGIGAAINHKIATILQTGQLPQLEQYIANTPPGIRDLMGVKGIGPKKLSVIWKEMGIETAGELLYACNEDRLTRYKGFGAKTQQSIGKAITYYLQTQGHCLYADGLAFSAALQSHWQKALGSDTEIIPTGALRRQDNTLSELAYVTAVPQDKIAAALPDGFRIAAQTPETLTLAGEAHPDVVLYFTSKEQIGSTLFETTGNASFVQAFFQQHPQLREQVFATEEALFEAACALAPPPALRESPPDQVPAVASLIKPEDIRGIIHSHSTWSDGKNTLEEMALAARDMGMEYLVISDHSKSAGYAQGLQVERVLAQHQEIAALNQKLAPFKIFKSIESDILADGALDYDPDILATFDLVIASVHSNLKMEQDKAMQRLLTAIANPYTTILGHPTGRLLLSREGYPIDHKKIIDACVAHQVVIEINAHPRRLDLDWHFVSYAIEQGALLSIDPDAHSTTGMHDIRYGAYSAQKGGLSPTHNLSSFSLAAFETYIRQSKQKKSGA